MTLLSTLRSKMWGTESTLYDEIYQEMLVDYLMSRPETEYPTDVSFNPQQKNQEIADLVTTSF